MIARKVECPSDKIDFEKKNVSGEVERYFIMKTGLIQWKDTIINIYASKRKHQNTWSITDRNEEINNSKIIIGEFNTSLYNGWNKQAEGQQGNISKEQYYKASRLNRHL